MDAGVVPGGQHRSPPVDSYQSAVLFRLRAPHNLLQLLRPGRDDGRLHYDGICDPQYSISTAQIGNMPPAWSLFQPALGSTSVTRRVFLVLIALGSLFWATADLAYESVLSEAIHTERALGADIQVVVYSKQRLDLLGNSIASVTLPPSETAAYRS